ncbi:MAG: valine--tRNA ligase [Amoebophilaceae bacterium]|nr:valine--tRNA ligase [Amoebophilaceae bacterium]
MQTPLHYNHKATEPKWYAYWLENGFFRAVPNADREPYTVIMPPPNVTGRLHMGHILNNTLQDVLVRKARMEGKEACWVPGLDHASIATEAKVVAMLQQQGIFKHDLTRAEFLQHAWSWKNKYGGIILEQLKKLGISCDWERTCFTLDQGPAAAVQTVFIQLYERGYIYQSKRMINWDPAGKTALADDEVIYKEVQTKLYYIRYRVVGHDAHVTIATTRPETILGDTAVCVHPQDTRYQHLQGKQVLVPLVNRPIPIITDTYVDPAFGTGCLKVTPAHDMNDYILGEKHHLATIDILNEDGTLNEAAGHYMGKDRFVARQKIVQQLDVEGYLVKTEDYSHNVGFSERTDAVVEPRLSTQWFVKMQALSTPALKHVLDGTIRFYPAKFQNMYETWLNEVQDWCISRQLWWGHRIPAYYLSDGSVVVAHDKATALKKAQEKTDNSTLTEEDLRQDKDVLDTWFSSWLWPMSVFDGIQHPNNPDFRYFYPTNDLVTAPEIIFFWVARMIMAGYAFQDTPPFRNVYFTGIVRDQQHKKMSKSLGNSPEPIELIEQYGADGIRVGMLLSAPAGNDLLFDIKRCEQGRNFANKIWNAFRLLQHWQPIEQAEDTHTTAIQWFQARLSQVLEEVHGHFQHFRISDVLMALYKLVWDDFCSWYLEMIKPAHGKAIAVSVYSATVKFLECLLKLLHPFMPFITEELWHQLRPRQKQDCLIIAPWPQTAPYDPTILRHAATSFELVTTLRSLRKQGKVLPNQYLPVYVKNTALPTWLTPFATYVKKLAYLADIVAVQHEPKDAISCSIQGTTFYLTLDHQVDTAKEKMRLERELAYTQGFLESVLKKLNNECFIQHAPEQVVANERKKQADAQVKCTLLEERLRQL